ncbi:phosphotransferase [Streptomyces anulatus]
MTLTTSGETAVSAPLLYEASRRAIAQAAEDLWPGRSAVLGPQCPSVTSYVCQVLVDGQELYAKYSWLSSSLVSILRGARGAWVDVKEAQELYVNSVDLVTRREYQHLRFLQQLGRPRVCETAGFRGGVLFTRAVAGPTIAEEVTGRPWDTAPLLDSVLLSLRELHGEEGARYLRQAWPINERSVVDVFSRKFRGPSSVRYVARLGRGRLVGDERLAVVDLLGNAVRRLLRLTSAIRPRQRTAVFGDLKPEHVYLSAHRLTFIDPALQWAAGPESDVAKLFGRTLLLGFCHHELRAERQITEGVVSALSRHSQSVSRSEGTDRAARLREVMVLWLMDTVNILSTCLSAPADLPLTSNQQALVSEAHRIAAVAERVSGLLIGSASGLDLLDAVFHEVEHTALDLR